MFLCYYILTWLPTSNLGSLYLFSRRKLKYVLDLISIDIILIVLWQVLLYLISTLFNLSIYTFFDIETMYMLILFPKVLINSRISVITDFPSLCIEYFLYHNLVIMMASLIYLKTHYLYLTMFCLVYVL